MTKHPTMAELRTRVFKHSAPSTQHPARKRSEVGTWLARRVGRPAAVYGTWVAVRVGTSAHQVTLAALVAGLAAAAAIATGTRAGFVGGVMLAQVAYWLDHVDGQVARWRRTASLDGVYFDYLMHHAAALALGFGLGFGLAVRTGDLSWAAAGFGVAAGWTFLGLHNDCRYKAFFQRLKLEGRSYRVDGAGSRPAPPPPWPRRGRAALTWPLYKACEPHVVLLGLTALALLAIAAPAAWLVLWRGGVRIMAILAPALAVGRAARAILRGAVEAEFERWFRTGDEP
jgi:CDP-alcohol phosphatidyltransferase